MHKIYLTYTDQLQILAYKENGQHIPFNKTEQETFLSNLKEAEIIDFKEYDSSCSCMLENDIEIVFDSITPFEKEERLRSFASKITSFVEKRKIEELKAKYPKGYTPRTNRRKSSGKMIIKSIGLSASLLLGARAFTTLKTNRDVLPPTLDKDVTIELPKKEETESLYLVNDLDPKKEEVEVTFENPFENTYSKENLEPLTIDLAFEYKGDGKYESTKDYFGDILTFYSTRYGLPYDVVVKQLSQERPNIMNGVCENPYQISKNIFLGKYNGGNAQSFHVPVYDENGFTGTYDDFTCTEDLLNSTEGNIKTGCAYLRTCIDYSNSLLTGLTLYNQGITELSNACKYYHVDISNYKGDEHALEARDLIVKYLKEIGKIQGDFHYLENVFGQTGEDRSNLEIEYFIGSEKKNIAIHNTMSYNNDYQRGV